MTTRSIIRRIVPAVALLVAFIAPAVHAVGLNLTPVFPDLTTFNATMTNTWTPEQCFRSNGNPVDCSSPLMSGDMAAFWGGYSGVIASTFNMSPTFSVRRGIS